jgi:DNA-binding NarL/FixJ family response regulator
MLIDLKMPIVSGFEVLEWLGRNNLNIPAAVLSSSELPADREKAMGMGARDYISKRETFVDVLEFLRNWQSGRQ